MQDNYLNDIKVVDRLILEYKEHGNLIVAVDFDNTIYDYHQAGLELEATIDIVKATIAAGLEVFIFTANEDHELVRRHCTAIFGQPLAINTNSLNHLFDSRKPFYSILLDDRAGLNSAIWQLAWVVEEVNK
jgi:hypothetical protein